MNYTIMTADIAYPHENRTGRSSRSIAVAWIGIAVS